MRNCPQVGTTPVLPLVLRPHLLTEMFGFKDKELEKPSVGICIWKGFFSPNILSLNLIILGNSTEKKGEKWGLLWL